MKARPKKADTTVAKPVSDAKRKKLNARAMADLVYQQTEIIRIAQEDVAARVTRFKDEPKFWKQIDALGIRDRL